MIKNLKFGIMGEFLQGEHRKRSLKALDAHCEDSLAGNATRHSLSEAVSECTVPAGWNLL